MKSICKHCEVEITYYDGILWHEDIPIFPQYCRNKGDNSPAQLHEPIDNDSVNHNECQA